jgi:hypothetical protein
LMADSLSPYVSNDRPISMNKPQIARENRAK